MAVNPYIAVEGAIGVGKTTLARILGESLSAEVLLEVFEENPFLSDFYSDRVRYAFQTQVFFLLSRYRQQHRVIAATLRRNSLISDYLFDKDWLFAHLNLAGDELAMYERVHAILGEQIPAPSLVVYMRATTGTLMERIAYRDRAYERQMARDYLESLRLAYEAFFERYAAAPVLVLDTDELDFVHDVNVRISVVGRVKNALQAASHQLPLLAAELASGDEQFVPRTPRLADLQRAHRALDGAAGLSLDPISAYLGLTQATGKLGAELALALEHEDALLAQMGNRQEARDRAMDGVSVQVRYDLADLLISLVRFANDAGIDLERAYLERKAPGRMARTVPEAPAP